MSADEVLAANLWPWPDPLLKRDRNGQVMFVNAAFLQLYGGRIEDWRGNMVAGWPSPAPQGAQRFETKAGEAPHESVYDWVEMVMADGNAMAIARNVTALITAPTPPANQFVPPPLTETSPPLQQSVQPAATLTPTPDPAPVEATPPPAPVQEPAPVFEAQPEPVQEHMPAPEAAPQKAPDVSEDLEDTLNRSADDYLNQPTSEQQEIKSAPAQAVEFVEQPQPAQQEEAEPERMIERRALPIEDSTAVLGSNWRDQVIAKAVGAETPVDEDAAEEARDTSPDLTSEAITPTGSEIGSNAASGLNILLAEDNAINALLTRTLLEAEGASVDTVEDGALALEAVQKEKYDLIFMDMRMPNMDGLESTRKIRALGGAYKDLPIVALTANAFDDDRNACFDSGMNDFMTKPVSAEELQEMVLNWTKERQKMAS
ncbi:MAG: response regulator [Acidimicrobiales bacterium]|nr:response regulator [Hyphomonadaceae bacterium]RZV45011.1 MAG: response regulator [Acidimicrobiales bacterium]